MKKFLFIFPLLAAASIPAAAQSQAPIRVNCGGSSYTDAKGQVWQADYGYNGGNAFSNTANIAGTADQKLFHSARYAASNKAPVLYTFPVSSGSYHVNLYFAEVSPTWNYVGARVFNVKVEGNLAFQNLDVFAAVGANTALVKRTDSVVTDGKLTIELDSITQQAEISAIEITQTVATPQLRLNFIYPDGTPVSGALNYNVTTASSSMSGNQPLNSGQATCLLIASPQLLGLVGTMNVNLSLTDTAGHSLWQIALSLNPASANFAAVESSTLQVVVRKQ